MPLKNYDSEINKDFGGLKLLAVDNFVVKGERRKCRALCNECKNVKEFNLHKVLEGIYKSCGCLKIDYKNRQKTDYQSFIGKVIGGYRILEYTNENNKRLFKVECLKCEKKNLKDAYKIAHNLSGKCSCHRQHHMAKTPLYNRWKGIKNRCLNPNAVAYPHYGGRGITIFKEWADDFQAFYDYVGDPPTPKHQLDRIDNEGNYEPGNVRWVTSLQNVNNQREKTFNKTGYQNVSYKSRGVYESGFEYDKKYYHVGSFKTAKEAYEACQKAKIDFKNNNDIV